MKKLLKKDHLSYSKFFVFLILFFFLISLVLAGYAINQDTGSSTSGGLGTSDRNVWGNLVDTGKNIWNFVLAVPKATSTATGILAGIATLFGPFIVGVLIGIIMRILLWFIFKNNIEFFTAHWWCQVIYVKGYVMGADGKPKMLRTNFIGFIVAVGLLYVALEAITTFLASMLMGPGWPKTILVLKNIFMSIVFGPYILARARWPGNAELIGAALFINALWLILWPHLATIWIKIKQDPRLKGVGRKLKEFVGLTRAAAASVEEDGSGI